MPCGSKVKSLAVAMNHFKGGEVLIPPTQPTFHIKVFALIFLIKLSGGFGGGGEAKTLFNPKSQDKVRGRER